jgi:hypothetical protein
VIVIDALMPLTLATLRATPAGRLSR